VLKEIHFRRAVREEPKYAGNDWALAFVDAFAFGQLVQGLVEVVNDLRRAEPIILLADILNRQDHVREGSLELAVHVALSLLGLEEEDMI
jgi:hypothetical protein